MPPESIGRARLHRSALPLLLLTLLLAVQLRSEFSTTTLLAQSLLNALHVPWAVLTTLLLWRVTGLFGLSFSTRLLVTLLLAVTASVGTEAAQHFVADRTPSQADLLNNLFGTGLALAWVARRHLQRRLRPPLTLLLLFTGLGASLIPPGLVIHALAQQRLAFPVLFGSEFPALQRLVVTDAMLVTGEPLRIRFDDRPYPGLAFTEQQQSWRGYSQLLVTVDLNHDRPIVLTAATHLAGDETRGPTARVDRPLAPGHQRLVYPVSALLSDPEGSVERLLLYGRGHQSGAELTLRRIELRR